MKKYLLIGLIVSAIFFFSSCSSDESDAGNLVKKIKFVGANWNFDFENHIIEFEYDNGKIISYSDGTGHKVDFFYTNNLITHVDKYIRINGESEFYFSVDFFYDSLDRLEKFEFDYPGSSSEVDESVVFTYIDDQNANFVFTSNYEQDYIGSVMFDENNVNKLIKNNYEEFGYIVDKEYIMNYDTNKHILSEVVGFNNLKLYNIFHNNDFYNMEGLGIYAGAKNNLTFSTIKEYNNGNLSFEADYNQLSYQYNNNGFPKEVSKNSESRMLFEF